MKNWERQIGGLPQIRSLHLKLALHLGTWETIPYSFEDKGEACNLFFKIRGILLRILTYIKESSKRRISCKVTITGILYASNIYFINFHLKLHNLEFTLTVFFIKTRV